MSQYFEVVVVGGRLSGVLTAALLARRGVRGLLIDEGELGPQSGPDFFELMNDYQGSPIVRSVHEELGLLEELPRRLPGTRRAWQLIDGDLRLEITSLRALQDWLQPEDKMGWEQLDLLDDAISTFIDRVGVFPDRGFFARSRIRRWGLRTGLAAEHHLEPRAHRLRSLLAWLAPYTGHIAADGEPPIAVMARSARQVLPGRLVSTSGQSERALLLDLAPLRAFEVEHARVSGLAQEGRQFRIDLEDQPQPVRTEVLVDASSRQVALRRLGEGRWRWRRWLDTLQPRQRVMAFGVELDTSAVPPYLGTDALLVPRKPDEPAVWLSRRDQRADRTELLLRTPLPAEAGGRAAAATEAFLWSRLEAVIPFFSDAQPTWFEPGRTPGRAGPALAHPLYPGASLIIEQLGRLPVRTPHARAFLAGPPVLPGLGAEGEYWTALQVTRRVERILERARRRQRVLLPART